MGSKVEGKERALVREHAVREECFCSDCGWFSYEYRGLRNWCRKWMKEVNPRRWAKYGTTTKCDGFIKDPMKRTLFVGQNALLLVQPTQKKERYAWVLDYIPNKYPERKRKHVVQAVGEDYFTLMELTPKGDNIPREYERVYIGEGRRDIIDRVNRGLRYEDLTDTARERLPYALEKIVKQREKFFLETLFNREIDHVLLLKYLPMIKGKDLEKIQKERQREKFKSFEDLERRTGLLFPERAIARRIEEELIRYYG